MHMDIKTLTTTFAKPFLFVYLLQPLGQHSYMDRTANNLRKGQRVSRSPGWWLGWARLQPNCLQDCALHIHAPNNCDQHKSSWRQNVPWNCLCIQPRTLLRDNAPWPRSSPGSVPSPEAEIWPNYSTLVRREDRVFSACPCEIKW